MAEAKLDLRPLELHVDGGLNSQEAVDNVEKIIDRLGFEAYAEVIDWEEMKDRQLAYFESGVPYIATP